MKSHNEAGHLSRNYIIYIALFSVLILLRRPDAILHPQFFAEEGIIWYKNAYLFGIHSIFKPEVGYFVILPGIVAVFSQIFPLSCAPLIFNLVAFVAQLSPIAVFLSDRFNHLVPNTKLKIFICLCYVLIPNSAEINMNLNSAHWHLAILSFLLIVSREPKQVYIKVIDYTVLVISGLSCLFSIFLSPIALFELYKERSKENFIKASIVCGTGVIALFTLLESMETSSRSNAPLGASVKSLLQILGNNIFAGGILGNVETMGIIGPWMHRLNYIFVPIAIILIVMALARGPVIYREFVFFVSLILGSALFKPMVSLTEPQWPILENLGSCERYFALPIFAWIVTLIILSFKGNRIIRYFSISLITLMFVLLPFNFFYPKFIDTDFYTKAGEFEQAPPGTNVVFQINPDGWSFALTKK